MSDTAWPADTVERVATSDLTPYARNSRTHSDAQIEQIAASMLEFGFTMPILRDENGNIIAGHGRVLAAELNESRGHANFASVPTTTARGWTETQKRAYVIADNKLSLNAGWDSDALALEMTALMEEGFDTELTGFTEDEIAKMMPSEIMDDMGTDDFQPEDAGQSTTGTQNATLKFAGQSIPISQDEVDRLKDALERYVEERGVTYGFVTHLLDTAVLTGNFRG